jgi:hypothetical protein
MQKNSKFLDDIISRQRPNHDKSRLRYNRQKRNQTPKKYNKKNIKNVMQKQSKGIGRPTRKFTGTLLHREDSDFRIDDR